MKITHKIKLIGSRLRWYSELVVNSVKYRKEVKEVSFIQKKRKELMLELLAEQRVMENEEKIAELRAKLSIINEILTICS
jgi:cytoplasmic iron level regulating protein YaaA (DUF328/UPF0246 family)